MGKLERPKKIGILGPFGFGNLGDAAMQRAMIQHIRKYFPDAQIVGFSMNPEDTEARHSIATYPITRRPEKDFTRSEMLWRDKKLAGRIAGWFQYNPNPSIRKMERVLVRIPTEVILAVQSYRHLAGLDLLIFSGGGQLDDLWGGPWKHPYVLCKFSLLARLRRIKVFFVSVGVESVYTFFGKLFVKIALAQASYKSFRDRYSKDFVEQTKLDSSPGNVVYPDLAHSLDILENPTTEMHLHKAPVVGVNLVPFYDPRFWPLKDTAIYQDYLTKMAALVRWLLERKYIIKFIRSDIYPDSAAAVDLMKILNQSGISYSEDQILEPQIGDVDDLVEQLVDTDYVVASRLHTVLLAQDLGKPVIGLSYQSKIDKLMEDTGQAEYCLPIASFDPENLQQQFIKLEANCEEIEARLTRKAQEYRVALDEQYERIFELV